MVFLHQQKSSLKRDSSSSSKSTFPVPPSKIPKSVDSEIEKMVSILADAGCTLMYHSGPPCLPSDPNKFRRHLTNLLSHDSSLRSHFLVGFSSYVQSPKNFTRVLSSLSPGRSDSLVRQLLLVPCIQLDLMHMLLEKLPEFFDVNPETQTSLSFEEDVGRLIISQFRWLDFLVDPKSFTEKLMEVLCICPLHLKKEIIGSLPEIIGDQSNNKSVIDSLQQMLSEDSAIIVPVLDSFSNLNLDDELQEQHLKFVGVSNSRASQQNKLKGKSLVDNSEASILDALRSSLRFKNMLCQEILKEIDGLKKPQDHKVIDIWLLVLMYMNGDPLRKSVSKIFKKKVIEDCIHNVMLDQCIRGNKELVQDHFPSFLSLSEYLLACKEQKAREFGIHVYTCLFEEFTDTYSRQEVLGALITHVGSGVSFEVYEVFSSLALSARTSAPCYGTSIANELLMVVRKQVSHSELKYKKMGLIGALKIVSYLGDASIVTSTSPSQKSNAEEAVELLKTSLNCCKQLYLPLTLFYDELTAILNSRTLQPEIIEWIVKHVGEFESIYLSDLECGQLSNKDSFCGIEGELWMNLDGDISPICLNILPLASSSSQSASLQVLHANFLLLSTVERLTNQGSLGGIDALLGCPLHLPSSKCFSVAGWQSLTEKQKQIVTLSLYHAANWIRELLNAFCTQVAGRLECISQTTKQEIIAKLLKRVRNLVVLESLLNYAIKCCPQSLPDVHLHVEKCGSSLLSKPNTMGHMEKKNEHIKTYDSASQDKKRRHKKISKASTISDTNCKLRQPTILDVLRKSGNLTSQGVLTEDALCTVSNSSKFGSVDETSCGSNEPVIVEVSALAKVLETQRFKFRPLLFPCLSILTFSKNQDSCCSDPAAELPLYLYLLRDLHYKLDYFSPPSKLLSPRFFSIPAGFTRMTVEKFLSEVKSVLPYLRKHFDSAVTLLKEGDETCEDHWKVQSAITGNPDIPNLMFSKSSVSSLVIKEVLNCFSKMLNLPEAQKDKSVLSDLLQSFQPIEIPASVISDIQPIPLPGTIDYLYLGAFSFLEGVLNIACSFSFMLASESLLTLESIVISLQKFLDKLEGNGKSTHSKSIEGSLHVLHERLGTSAQNLLQCKWDNESLENGWKNKGDIVQKILWIYLEHSKSTCDLLHELACSILPQVTLHRTIIEDNHHGFPTLCPATLFVWYRVLMKEVVHLERCKTAVRPETIQSHLMKMHKCVNVVVSLVSMCRNHEKVTIQNRFLFSLLLLLLLSSSSMACGKILTLGK
ncbi:hypothetical protein CISIN_1g000816mg [Citrus sinensis]|uniref:Fanconi anemia group D2 protein n=1 Tax=Citrus sinensis TaxID=2711 RepID=A0A067FMA1_CITSI|nr:hypothetical protein CISIN_1g000816mg [Citrus sinensis]